MAFVDDERDDPPADGDFDADVGEKEEGHEVDGAEAEDLLVLVHALERLFRLLVRGLAGFFQALCNYASARVSNHAVGTGARVVKEKGIVGPSGRYMTHLLGS